MTDPIVDEVHAARARILAECGNDLEQLIARLKAAESKHASRLVTIEDFKGRSRTDSMRPVQSAE